MKKLLHTNLQETSSKKNLKGKTDFSFLKDTSVEPNKKKAPYLF
ncbi:hypothetical protein RV00_GL001127 [Enterococcus devriesei]|uniref:Uncharacterized protein n=1 Tax=Enterococcus devriesei TaxID=319970 RepID=A0A1L8SXP7_9ENTE|nr:hypothetical protein RV00_GL001127 [Enterococcus devriesei]